MTETEKIEANACHKLANSATFLWWRNFRSHFPRFDTFNYQDMNNFYSDVFSIIAEEMSKDDMENDHA
jgi:hypothetical protein